MKLLLRIVLSACLLAACAHRAPCDDGAVRLTADFEAARADRCRRTGDAAFTVEIRPETTPINPSPWYAFRLASDEASIVDVTLVYQGAAHRYHPKVRPDAGSWTSLDEERLEVRRAGRRARLRIDVAPGATLVAGQPLIPIAAHRALEARIAAGGAARLEPLGESLEGRPLTMLASDADRPDAPLVVFIGRQHPPELPGAVAMFAFVDRVFADDALASAFRKAVHVRAATLLNPDGVARGHWRTSAGLVDLNRDWGPFEQPETRAVRDMLEREAAAGRRPSALVDFHATRKDVYYSLPDDSGVVPANFAREWLAGIEALTGRAPERESSWSKDRPVAKNWFPLRWGAPALTAEFGDDTPPDEVAAAGVAAAEAFMRLFVEGAYAEPETAR